MTSYAWTDVANEYGYRGEVLSPGVAGHGSTSPWDIRPAFVAAGPDIKGGLDSTIPTGNIDLVPTVLELMGAPIPMGLDGRVLTELLLSGPSPEDVVVETDPVLTSAEVGDLLYELTVFRSRVGSTTYFDGTDVLRTPAGGR